MIWHPTDEQQETGTESKILIEPAWRTAEDQNTLFLQMVREVPTEYADKLKQVEILIRPF